MSGKLSEERHDHAASTIPVIVSSAGQDIGAVQEDVSIKASGQLLAQEIPADSVPPHHADHGADDFHWSIVGNGKGLYGHLSIDQHGRWVYTLDDHATNVQALAQGESVTETFTVKVTDESGAVATHVVTVDIAGTNDAPVISAAHGQATGTVQEDGTLSAGGQLTATDVDHGSQLTWSVAGNGAGTYGTLSVDQTGHWTYSLNNADSNVQALDGGEHVIDKFTIQVTDEFGATDSRTVVIHVVGTDDAPIIAGTTTGAVQEDVTLSASGQLSLMQIDQEPADSHDSHQGDDHLNRDSHDGNSHGDDGRGDDHGHGDGSDHWAFPDGYHGDHDEGAWNSPLTWSVANSGAGTYGTLSLDQTGHWTYSLNDSAANVQALAQGETVADAFTVSVTNARGDVVTQTLVVNVAGTNDAPVITAAVGQDAGGVQEDTVVQADGQLTASDVDHGAQLTWSVAGDPTGTYGVLSVDQTGHWTYALDNNSSNVQALAQGETVTDTFNVQVADEFGAMDTRAVTVTIAGTNDAPVITAAVGQDSGNVQEDTVVQADGQLTGSDVDHGAQLTWSIVGDPAGTYGALSLDQTGHWTYALDNGASNVQALAQGQTVSDTFTVQVADEFGATDTHTVTVDIAGTNDAPVITSSAQDGNVQEDSVLTATGQVTATDVDALDTLSYAVAGGGGAYGSLGVDATTGQWTYTLNNGASNVQALGQGETVQDSFTVQVSDGHGGIATQQVDVSIAGTNDAPVVGNIVAATDQNTPTTAYLSYYDPDANDTDTVTLFTNYYSSSGPYLGSGSLAIEHDFTDGYVDGAHVVLNSNGSVSFDPGHSFDWLGQGQTTDVVVDYRVTDSFGASTTGTIDVTVTGANDAPVVYDVAATTDQNTPTTAYLSYYEPDWNDTDTVTLFQYANLSSSASYSSSFGGSGPVEMDFTDGYVHGAHVQMNSDGSVSFDPNHAFDWLGQGQTTDVAFNYRVTDSFGASTVGTVDITVTGTNDAPVVDNVLAATDQNTPTTAWLGYYDPDANDTDTVTLFQNINLSSSAGSLSVEHDFTDGYVDGAHVVLNADGSVSFDPNHAFDWLGQGQTTDVAFNYRVTDSFGATTTAAIDVTVTGENDAPVITSSAQDASGTVQAVHPATTFSGTMTADNQFAIYVSSDDSQLGTLLGTGNNWGQPFVFNAASLTQGTTNYIHIVATNVGGPGGVLGSFSLSDSNFAFTNGSTVENTTAADWKVSLTGFGSNYQTPVNEGVNTVGVTPWSPLSSISSASDWMWSYDSHNGGNDTFTEYFSMQISSVMPSATGHLTASDVDQGATQSWSVVGSDTGTYGSLAVDANTGVWTYSLDNNSSAVVALGAGQTADDSFIVRVTDDHGATADQLVTVHVNGINDAPTAFADTTTTDQNTSQTINVLANDTDPDSGDTLTLTNVSIAGDALGRTGIASIVNNQIVFNPNTQFVSLGVGQSTTNVVTYTISDGHGGTSTATDTITVTGINDAPVAIADTAATDQNTAKTIDVLANDIDQDRGDTLTITNAGILLGDAQGRTGTVSIVNNQVVFNPDGQFASLAQGQSTTNLMFYTVSDGHGGISQAVDTITVTGTNDAPVIASGGDTSGAVLVNTTETADGQLLASDADNGSILAWSVENNGTGTYGTLAVDQTGHWTYTLDNSASNVQAIPDGQHVTDSFLVDVTDEFGADATEAVSIDITGAHVANPIVASNGLTAFAIAGGNGVNGGAGASSTGGAGTVGGNGTAGTDGSPLNILHTAQILSGDTGNDTLDTTVIANGATGGSGGIGGSGGASNPSVSASSSEYTSYNGQGYATQYDYYTTYSEYENYNGAAGGDGGAGGSGSSVSAMAQLDLITGSGGADSLTLSVEALGADGGAGGVGGTGGNTGPSGYYDYTYLSGTNIQTIGYSSSYSIWSGYTYTYYTGPVNSYQHITTNYYPANGSIAGGNGGVGGVGGDGSASTGQAWNDSVSGGDGNDTLSVSAVATAGNGGHGGTGGAGGDGAVLAGTGGHGGDGGQGGDASVVLIGNALDGGSGDDTLTLSAVAHAGNGGDGGDGGQAGFAQYIAFNNGGTTTDTFGTGGAGGDGGAYGTASIDVNGNVLNGGDGNDVLTISASLTGGSSGAGGAGGSAGTGGSTTISDSYGPHTLYYVAGTVGASGGSLVGAGTDQISITGNMVSGGNGDDTLKLAIDATNAHGLSLTVMGNIFDGGAGNNTLDLSHVDVAGVSVDLGSGMFAVNGAIGFNTVLNIVNVIGTQFGDTLAGAGNGDTLTGGVGTDLFEFHANGQGNNSVADFLSGTDHIELIGSGLIDGNDVLAHTADDGLGNAVIHVDANDTVTLTGVATASLHATDFLLA